MPKKLTPSNPLPRFLAERAKDRQKLSNDNAQVTGKAVNWVPIADADLLEASYVVRRRYHGDLNARCRTENGANMRAVNFLNACIIDDPDRQFDPKRSVRSQLSVAEANRDAVVALYTTVLEQNDEVREALALPLSKLPLIEDLDGTERLKESLTRKQYSDFISFGR